MQQSGSWAGDQCAPADLGWACMTLHKKEIALVQCVALVIMRQFFNLGYI
ncbi:hypothetical protein AW27_012680 [Streptomyces sp. PCS3-D2]|nr:hypothetical protein [Streptomyces sp. PCS3-D2]WKV72296.1 hypothetical protein AW27_012680 [Streptomyces sp. PCS3-D2]